MNGVRASVGGPMGDATAAGRTNDLPGPNPCGRQIPTDPEALITPEELSYLLAVPKRTIEGWAAKKYGPHRLKIGGRAVRYRRRDVDAWLAKLGGRDA
jgi:excisionase family DNA binding protein